MSYSESAIAEINNEYWRLNLNSRKLMLRLGRFLQQLKNEKAREYLTHGARKRLKTLTRIIDNIFTIFSVDRIEHLSKDELTDISINLHAFL